MATFEAKVYRLKIEEHPNADALELAVVGDYRSIVRKGQFKTGDLGVYIPEQAIVPDWMIKELGLEGKLAGKDKNRVRAVKLRGILSQGLVYPVQRDVNPDNDYFIINVNKETVLEVREGDVVTDFLGIEKYEPPIPVHMAGEVFNAFGKTIKYDIENFKKYPDVLQEGEDVVMTEKIHGTFCLMGYHPDIEQPIVTSKGLSARGVAFKFNEANKNNLYVKAFQQTIVDGDDIITRIRKSNYFGELTPFYILGEIFGQGVQDLQYGADTPQFRVFDVCVGEPGQERYLNHKALVTMCEGFGLTSVPVLYKGPFSKEIMEQVTNGKETVSGKETNIREGIVIEPLKGRIDVGFGRVILKNVSEKYLLRKGGTEYN